ncbi:MAG: RpiB/LacA/LacB family sugar-phosphate isomerase [Syntrophales bacterium]
MNIVIAADPFATALKDAIKRHLEQAEHSVIDVGTKSAQEVTFFNASRRACAVIQEGRAERGILFCGSGMGVAIVANKHVGITAACVESVFAARLCRAINNANVLCLGAMIWGEWMAKEAVDVFLKTEHTEGLDNLKEFLIKACEEVNAIDENTRKR